MAFSRKKIATSIYVAQIQMQFVFGKYASLHFKTPEAAERVRQRIYAYSRTRNYGWNFVRLDCELIVWKD